MSVSCFDGCMFGILRPCMTHLDPESADLWRAHMCGVCLSLRSGHGQLSRLVTNTDAVVVSILVDAQRDSVARTVTAGPCALRGMRTAQVIAPGELSVRLGAITSLTLASAKAADVLAEQATGLAASSRLRARGARVAGPRLRREALADAAVSSAIGCPDLLDDLSAQAEVEMRASTLDEITDRSARAAAAVFAATAELAGVPENREVLRLIGSDFGRCAHLLDAVIDLEKDGKTGDFNPLLATGTSVDAVRDDCRRLLAAIRSRIGGVRLRDDRLVTRLLVGGLDHAITDAFGHHPEAVFTSPGSPPHRPPLPPFHKRILPWAGVYCTGYACCADHTNPCNGKRHQSGAKGCCNNVDCCDCCDCCDC
ncbi:DUF5685 family protein [Williamsia sp.]|uniref:DUF5685 family protein n=1 Tax=Williamsia sp. TaxID=1872085 RepID=UPI002F9331D9